MSKMTSKRVFGNKEIECVIKVEMDVMVVHFTKMRWDFATIVKKKSPDEAIAIVQKWGEEHPVTTIKDKLFEVFPNTQKYSSGLPQGICPDKLGYKKGHCGSIVEDCVECWSQPYIEKK